MSLRRLVIIALVTVGALGPATAAAAASYPSVTADAITADAGTVFSGEVGTFVDTPDPKVCAAPSNYKPQTDWGDGTTSSPTIALVSGPDQSNLCHYSVSDTHTYADPGRPTLTVRISGGPNGQTPGSASATATVGDSSLRVTPGGTQHVTAGAAYSGPLATFTDNADPPPPSGYSVSVDWGDGTTAAGTVVAGATANAFTVNGAHTWSAPGTYTVTVTVTRGPASASGRFDVVVAASSPPPPGGSSPQARLSVTTPAPSAGRLITLSGAGSTSSSPIVSYQWDFNGDGHPDTSTGTDPVAHVVEGPGTHTVNMTVIAADGSASTTSTTFTVSGRRSRGSFTSTPRTSGCVQEVDIRTYRIVAGCIVSASNGYTITGPVIDINGATFFTRDGSSGTFHISYGELSGPDVVLKLDNLPLPGGDLTLGGLNLSRNGLILDGQALRQHNESQAPGLHHAQMADDAHGVTRLVSLAIGHDCPSGSHDATCCPDAGPTTACATLPGGFPLAGQINVSINSHGQALFDLQAAIRVQSVGFSASAGVRIVADLDTGVHLDSLHFAIPDSSFSIFSLKDTSFDYYWPGCSQPDLCDSWQAQAKINFAAVGGPELDGELDFHHGSFHHLSLVLTLPPGVGVPLFPGVLLNRLGGEFGVDPLVFGGSLGASIGSQLEATVSFRYREASPTELGVFGLQGTLELSSTQIAQLAFDLYSDGYIDGALDINLGFPLTADPDNQTVKVGGHVGFWDEPSSGRYEGTGSVYLKLWVINASVAAVINQDWVAGCASLGFLAFGAYIGGGVAGGFHRSDGSVNGFPFAGSCDDEDRLTSYETAPTTSHSGGFVGSVDPGAGRPMALPAVKQEEIRLTGNGGVPVVTLTAPDGKTFTTSTDVDHPTGAPAHDGAPAYISVRGPEPNTLLIAVVHPQAGVWHVSSAPGTPAVTKAEIAQVLPSPSVHVRVRSVRGGREALTYRIANLAGAKVEFNARGTDSGQLIGAARGASGTIVFRPTAALGRVRRIEAEVTAANGQPLTHPIVASFRAPALPRPGRPGHVRIVRRGSTAVITWGAAHGAWHYLVRVIGSDGRRVPYLLSARHRRIVLTDVLSFERFTVRVAAQGGIAGLTGRPATAVLKRASKPPAGL